MNKKLSLSARLLLLAVLFHSSILYSCDDVLKSFPIGTQKQKKFKRDCLIQDRYERVRNIFRMHRLDITDVAEYRALRFIDRYSWEKNVTSEKLPPKNIYRPVPVTWDVWDRGISEIFQSDEGKNELFQNLTSKHWLNDKYLSRVNKILLTDGSNDIQDPYSGEFILPGKMRYRLDRSAGFCTTDDYYMLMNMFKRSTDSVMRYQQMWENEAGLSFKNVVKQLKGKDAKEASFFVKMEINSRCNVAGYPFFVSYSPASETKKKVDWIRQFLRYNLLKYQEGKPVIPPIELSAVVQKWFVTIHPFSDGNGRTSRAIQDLILQNFDLPFAPAGDLQNDAMEEIDIYIKNTYTQIESTLNFLEGCASNLEQGKKISYRCQSATELNR